MQKEVKNRYKAVIGQRTYVVVGNQSNEHMKTATQLVSEQLDTIAQKTPQLSGEDCAILTALNAVSKQISLQQEVNTLHKRIKQLEGLVLDLKNPDQVLMRGLADRRGDVRNHEQMSLDELYGAVEQSNLFSQFDAPYVPAIHNKERE